MIKVAENICEYWDVRIETTSITNLTYEDYKLKNATTSPSRGAFIRVYEQGLWHYMSTTNIDDLSAQITELARQAQTEQEDRSNSSLKPYNEMPLKETLIRAANTRFDQVPMTEKKKVCEQYFATIQEHADLKNVFVTYSDMYKEKYFLSSTGIEYTFDFNQAGLRVHYHVFNEDEHFQDSHQIYSETLSGFNGHENDLTNSINESRKFLGAPAIEAGKSSVIMSSQVVGVFAHESFGHKSEADFMLGNDNAKEEWKIGKRVGSENLSIVDYGSHYGTSGYCPIDDEGFPTQKTYLIKNGILAGRLHNHHTAQVLDESPTGNARAMNFEFEPIVRMTNTYVEANDLTFEELLAKIDHGYYVEDFKHGSGLSTFTIAPRKAYLVEKGKITKPVKISVISGNVFETLSKIVGCSKTEQIWSSAFGGCGKMEQWPLPVGFGGSQVLIEDMMVS